MEQGILVYGENGTIAHKKTIFSRWFLLVLGLWNLIDQ